ncbi:hypothetical protein V2J09_019206 [Rumex salicifolius]
MEGSGVAAVPPSSSEPQPQRLVVVGKKKGKKGIELLAAGDVDDVDKRKKKAPLMTVRWCQADKCTADLSEAKLYHRRHKVCELHSKSHDVLVAGLHQRFHELWEFDDAKRSCRRRLAGHNERRRKTSVESSTAV